MTKLSFEQLLEHSRKSDELYAEMKRDERLLGRVHLASVVGMVFFLGLTVAGQDWAGWFVAVGFTPWILETFYLTPRRNKRLRWRRGNDWRGGE